MGRGSLVSVQTLSDLLGHAAIGGMLLLGAATVRDWRRHGNRGHAWLATAIGLLGAFGLLRQLTPVAGDRLELAVRDASLIAFLASGYALHRYRGTLLPLSRRSTSAMGVAVAAVAVAGVSAVFPGGPAAPLSPLQLAVQGLVVAVTGACVGEPALRFWLVAQGRPGVQRARLRALAAAYGLLLLLVLIFSVRSASAAGTLLSRAVALLAVPCLWVAFSPPAWLRRHWRQHEEEAFRRFTAELLASSRDRAGLAARILDWATRLVGGDAGFVIAGSGEILAVRGVEPAEATGTVGSVPNGDRPLIRRLGGTGLHLLVVPLRFEDGTGFLAVRSGPVTPLFGSDEVARLEQYAASVTAALDRVQLLDILAAQTARYGSLLQAISDLGEGVVITDAGRPVYVNDAYMALTGYSREELQALPSLLDLAPAEAREELQARLAGRLAGEEVSHHYVSQLVTRSGRRVDVENAVRLLEDPEGRRIVAIVRDVTDRLRAEETLRAFLEFAPDAIVIADERGCIVRVNAQTESVFGYARGELLGQPIELLLPERLRRPHRAHRRSYLDAPRPRPMGAGLELLGRRKDGSEFPVDISIGPLSTGEGRFVVAAVRDVTDRRQVERALAERMQDLAQIAATDPLTGLANRREFERLLEETRAAGLAILAIDVDDLKLVNDTYGHEAGDDHLKAIAEALCMGVRAGDAVARTGGDEFTALLPGTDLADAATVAERLRRIMHGVVVAHGTARITVGCAAGAAGSDPLEAWAAADEALYRAKQAGRDRVECARGIDVPTSVPSLAHWQPVIRTLIDERRVRAVFQPIVDLGRRVVVAFEALARPADGPLDASVESLFGAAQRLGVGRDLDWLCRRVALQDSHELPAGLPLFVNVGASALLDPVHDVDQMLLLLRWAGRPSAECVIEISEREAVRDLPRLREVLARYREHGFRFALDDVGEGHSTFEVLATAVPEFVKLSARLTRHATDRGAGAVIHSLATFAERTGTVLIAEGIETPEDLDGLRGIGATLGQGYWLGRPAPAAAWRQACDPAPPTRAAGGG